MRWLALVMLLFLSILVIRKRGIDDIWCQSSTAWSRGQRLNYSKIFQVHKRAQISQVCMSDNTSCLESSSVTVCYPRFRKSMTAGVPPSSSIYGQSPGFAKRRPLCNRRCKVATQPWPSPCQNGPPDMVQGFSKRPLWYASDLRPLSAKTKCQFAPLVVGFWTIANCDSRYLYSSLRLSLQTAFIIPRTALSCSQQQ